ncbi:MAG TPA: TonB-dependent receptor, partial [Rhodothermales bacterium]|nr:TonB-dependent receptor [Rhodothermales bacterium]
MRLAKLLCLLALLLPTSAALAQTGKIAGRVTDASTGDPLPGVAVMIEGTTQGSATDLDGYYTILNVRPGTYNLQATFVGYANAIQQNVRVNIDLTTTVDFQLQEATVGLGEVIVQAERPIVQPDVSANVASLSAADFENLPVAGVSEVLDLQAGIEPGLTIRGGGANEVAFVVDGYNMRTGRNQQPLTNISYTSVEEVQVQTGGFDAKYGNVRSGVVNVATKEPPRDRYMFDGIFRYSPIQDKAFDQIGQLGNCDYSSGNASATCDNFWIRPFLDPAVNMTGTDNGAWDAYTQQQYQSWAGWNASAEARQAEGFDVTGEDLLQYFKATHQKDNSIQVPDYDADFTFGGPLIPGISEKLGGLRFLASYRGTQTGYPIPQSRDAYRDNTFQLKLVTNLSKAIKVTAFGLKTSQRGQSDCQDCADIQMWGGGTPSYPWWGAAQELNDAGDNVRADAIYSDARFASANIDHNILGGTLTHTLSSKTFYEVTLQRMSSKYRSRMPNLRDESFICPDTGAGPDGVECEP